MSTLPRLFIVASVFFVTVMLFEHAYATSCRTPKEEEIQSVDEFAAEHDRFFMYELVSLEHGGTESKAYCFFLFHYKSNEGKKCYSHNVSVKYKIKEVLKGNLNEAQEITESFSAQLAFDQEE
ncbi:MAG: hypothetical protein GY781_07480, partial [Gammaproteobacteria bacterium]|nr:hypothetical protein [Gammaproteobacteria bacterium]